MWKTKTKMENAIHGRVGKMILAVHEVRQRAQRADSRRFHLAGAGLVVLFLVVATPTRAFAQSMVLYDGPLLVPPADNPCVPGDTITWSGRTVITFSFRSDGSGGTHSRFRVINKAQGTTTNLLNPKKYVLNNENLTDDNIPSGGSQDSTLVINYGVIRQEDTCDIALGCMWGDDFLEKVTFHFTVNAQGTPTATVTDFRLSCM